MGLEGFDLREGLAYLAKEETTLQEQKKWAAL
jgi:hypothetical protein